MFGGKSWESWVERYAESHRHPFNSLCHTIGIPLIALSVLLLLPAIWIHTLRWVALTGIAFGFLLQFVGHAVEGKPPEFLKDWRFLFVGLRWWWSKWRKDRGV
jgi:uncharacterized membrane protein YGL010W